MNIMGLSQEDQYNIFSLLAGILHLGNILFGDKNNYATVLSERGMFFSFILFLYLIKLSYVQICKPLVLILVFKQII
jgi:myosin heavy subunit